MRPRYVLGGRAFVPARLTTLKHDVHFSRILIGAGLRECVMLDGENLEAYSLRILKQVLDADALFACLACLIVPEEVSPEAHDGFWRRVQVAMHWAKPTVEPSGWTPEIAAQTEIFLGDLTSENDKESVYGLTAELLFPFFTNGTRSWASSLPSLKLNLGAGSEALHLVNGAPLTSVPGEH